MKRHICIFLACMIACTFNACKRRPLSIGDNNVQIVISIDRNIVNYTVAKDPSLMRVMFFDSKTGKFASQTFLPPAGGTANVLPGRTYDILVYNFDTENTVIGNENNFNEIYATTNLVPESLKSKLKSRSTKNDEELIVFEPDHLFVGRMTDVYIPARGTDQPPVTLEFNAATVVETWKLMIDKVQGVEWVGSINGVITGLTESNDISFDRKSGASVSVFFEALMLDKSGHLETTFNTFGYIPEERQTISLVITDIAGQGHEFNIDASKYFIDNEEQTIRIVTDQIVIDEPPQTGGGGGLAPDVDEWENIENDIII